MDPKNQTPQEPESQIAEEEKPTSKLTRSLSTTASITLSLSTILPTPHFLLPPKPINTTTTSSILPYKVKIPSQISSLSTLSLFSSFSPSKQTHFTKSTTISPTPLQNPLIHNPKRSSDPSNGAAIRRSSIVWFRNDLRVHDNEVLNSANKESMSVLPVYCFDPRDYGKSSSGFDKTGPYRANFLIESVSDLRKSLQSRGSDLVVRIGNPENVLVELAKAIGADAVYAHREVAHDEVKAEEKIENAMKEERVEVKYFWGSTLFHLDDLPFSLEDMPSNYGGFKERVKGLEIRNTIEVLDDLKGMPSRGDVEVGEIPTLLDLGLNPNSTRPQDGRPGANASLVGGETEALQRLQKFAAECLSQPKNGNKDGKPDSIYGANFSCKISPWLTMGCLSPRFMFDEIKKSASRTISNVTARKDNGTGSPGDGMNWLMFELLWRDFFRFITKKYSTTRKIVDGAPAAVTTCTGALA
ncbi:hypothetical protein MKX03_017036 [Papaver bracteatum]|nr:hypothetical protein MKX03_017036 [Papaver bracteatum]